MNNWPFSDSKNVVCFTQKEIIIDGRPSLLVTHDIDDGSWQFLSGDITKIENVMVLGLEEIFKIDSSIAEISTLRLGWKAMRNSIDEPWILSGIEKEEQEK